jgi:hypothetical protein
MQSICSWSAWWRFVWVWCRISARPCFSSLVLLETCCLVWMLRWWQKWGLCQNWHSVFRPVLVILWSIFVGLADVHAASQYILTGHICVLCCSVGIIYVAQLVHWKTTPICWWLAQTRSSPSIDRKWPGYDFPGAESTLLGNVPGFWNTRWNQFLVMNYGLQISKVWWVSFSPSPNHFDSRMGQASIIFNMCILLLDRWMQVAGFESTMELVDGRHECVFHGEE